MIRIVSTRNPCVPTRDVNGPPPPPGLYRTRLPETYAARTRPMAAKPNAARRSVSRSISPSPFTSLVGTQGFLVLTILIIALSFAYSVPGIHWKGVAGMDLLTNMVGFGVLCPLSGWVLIRPIESAPWWFIGTIALYLGALYAPTTASDY